MRCSVLMLDSPVAESEKTKPEDEARARKKESETEETDAVRPSSEKIPEGADNLRRRADWFQKRTGKTE